MFLWSFCYNLITAIGILLSIPFSAAVIPFHTVFLALNEHTFDLRLQLTCMIMLSKKSDPIRIKKKHEPQSYHIYQTNLCISTQVSLHIIFLIEHLPQHLPSPLRFKMTLSYLLRIQPLHLGRNSSSSSYPLLPLRTRLNLSP